MSLKDIMKLIYAEIILKNSCFNANVTIYYLYFKKKYSTSLKNILKLIYAEITLDSCFNANVTIYNLYVKKNIQHLSKIL